MGDKYLKQLLAAGHANKFLIYGLPPLLAALSTWVKLCCFVNIGYSFPFLLYFWTVLTCGVLGGWRSALLALIATITFATFWLLPSTNSLQQYTLPELILFGLEMACVVYLFHLNEHVLHTLHESETRYKTIIDQSAEAIIICDSDGIIKYASAAATRLLQRESKDLEGDCLLELIYPDDRQQFQLTQLKLQLRGSGSSMFRQRMLINRSDCKWTECCINNLLADQVVKAMILQIRDITHRVNTEKHQEDFLNMASHELKSPITAIRGFLQIAKKRYGEQRLDGFEQYFDRMHVQTEKLLMLIDDMLNLTKIKAGELSYHFEQTDVAVCIKEVVASMLATSPGRSINIHINDGIPAIQADPARIEQVITNLLSNALKYSPSDKPVQITLDRTDKQVQITVSDQGIGIPHDRLQDVFGRFYRVDSLPKGKFEGLGLGLYIASEIIRKHNGRIWVESKEGEGSSFKFTLPAYT